MNITITSTFFNNLSSDFSNFLENADDYNVIIKVGTAIENLDAKMFEAHSAILRARCSYFCAALSSNWAKKEHDKFILTLPNTLPDIFELILKYLYSGSITITENTNMLGLLATADELVLEELLTYVQKFLITQKTAWLKQNIYKVLDLAFKLDTAKELQEYCINIVTCAPKKFFASDEFCSIQESALVSILQQEEICLDEQDIWQHVIEWGLTNTPSLKNKELSNCQKEDCIELAKTLAPFFPHIRFSDIPKRHLLNKETLLPEKLQEELSEYYSTNVFKSSSDLLPPRARLCSEIITSCHSSLIASWIDHRDYTATGKVCSPYRFKLVFRASQENFSLKNLRREHLNVPIIIVAKVAGTGEVIGGYTPTITSTNKFIATKDSFIFSFRVDREPNSNLDDENSNVDGMENRESATKKTNTHAPIKHVLSRVLLNCWERAVTDISLGFLSFGMSDLRIGGVLDPKSAYCKRGNYELRIRNVDGPFRIDEYEIFQVLKVAPSDSL
ncbi:12604_t:CDS:2 [Ambispora gerdemannii]|uniref:12604_t:CDS:1 n=1 Tax=Ambispora gerdemannii TaxID=144530 RepID=A0A9N9AAD1_9GLOM|nr:12604_t:CDS:2 [Ambispora gerdemannii]